MCGAAHPGPEYVAARRVLLDVLEALGPQRKAMVLVGAQAIYLHVGEGDLAVAPYTTDGDLAVVPDELEDEPVLDERLHSAGFRLAIDPGTWTRNDVQIDLLVPALLAGAGRRGARLGVHGSTVARKATGLEAAVVDRTLFSVAAFENEDERSFEISLAGVAALMVAKLHKIAERVDDARRLLDKDALDVLRLLRFADKELLSGTLRRLERHPIAQLTTVEARKYLAELFSDRESVGARMAVRATAGLEDEQTVALSCEVLAKRLLDSWNDQG
jgi:hypothetical protein